MKDLKFFLPCILALLLLSACCKGPSLGYGSIFLNNLYFVNFTQGQMDSVQINEYRNGSNFTSFIDSVSYTLHLQDSVGPKYILAFDSTGIVPDTAINFLIFFPSANLTYRVTNITHRTHCGTCFCDHTVGYSVNGSAFSSDVVYPSPITITK